jgi:hypothetical protein
LIREISLKVKEGFSGHGGGQAGKLQSFFTRKSALNKKEQKMRASTKFTKARFARGHMRHEMSIFCGKIGGLLSTPAGFSYVWLQAMC